MRRTLDSLCLSLLTALAGGATGVAHAGGVVTVLHGTVANIHNTSPATTSALAAHGVVAGAAVTVTYTVESTTPEGNSPNPAFSTYPLAITDMVLSIGSYQGTQALPPGQETLDFVQVGNNVQSGSSTADSYLLNTVGADTGKILAGNLTGATIAMLLVFSDGDAKTIGNDGVVQDANRFTFGSGTVGGLNGFISINFDLQPGGGSGGPGPGLAQKGQLAAAGTFGASLLRILGKSASSPPGSDPFGAKEAASIGKAEEKFAKNFLKAVDKALKKGGSAPLPASSQGLAADNLEGNIDELEGALLTGADPDSEADRALRGKLFKAAAAQCAASLSALAAHAKKPSSTTLAAKLAKAENALLTRVAKAIDAAGKQGVTYVGPSGAEISDAVRALAEEFNQLTQGIAPALAAADAHAQWVGGAPLPHSF